MPACRAQQGGRAIAHDFKNNQPDLTAEACIEKSFYCVKGQPESIQKIKDNPCNAQRWRVLQNCRTQSLTDMRYIYWATTHLKAVEQLGTNYSEAKDTDYIIRLLEETLVILPHIETDLVPLL